MHIGVFVSQVGRGGSDLVHPTKGKGEKIVMAVCCLLCTVYWYFI